MTVRRYFVGSWGWFIFWMLTIPPIAFFYFLFDSELGTFRKHEEK